MLACCLAPATELPILPVIEGVPLFVALNEPPETTLSPNSPGPSVCAGGDDGGDAGVEWILGVMSLYDPGSGEAVRFVGVAVGPIATNIRPQDNSRITIVP
jgi:hypothetical protein